MAQCKKHSQCSKKALKEAFEICEKQGLRFTDSRKYVFETILENHLPTKAYDILDKLQKVDKSAKAPIIYRALDFLMANGLIHRLHSFNAYIMCSHPKQHNECYFLICNECGEIEECCSEVIARALAKVTKLNKFQPKNVTIEIKGICKSCSKLDSKDGL